MESHAGGCFVFKREMAKREALNTIDGAASGLRERQWAARISVRRIWLRDVIGSLASVESSSREE